MALEAVLFDLDGVIVSTDALHFESWRRLTQEEGIPFDHRDNLRLLGVSRMDSLEIVLEKAPRTYDRTERQDLADRKNRYFQEMIQELGQADLLPGSRELVLELRDRGIRTAVCSGSRNARRLVELLELGPLFEAVVDGNDITRTKPDPQVFLLGAERLGIPPAACLVIEDAEVGIQAAHAAGMKALGVGDSQRLGQAEAVVENLRCVGFAELITVFEAGPKA